VGKEVLDGRELRNAFGCFATGIAVVTGLDGHGQPIGVTINSFSSVSLDPPLVLWSINRTASQFETFNNCTAFVINILRSEDAALSTRFAMKGGARVDDLDTVPTEVGPPAISSALAVFECAMHARYDGGDHTILVGRIKHFTYVKDPALEGPKPLLYFRGRYGTWTSFIG